MAYSPISQVNITLQTTGITAQGFSTPIFVADIEDALTANPFGSSARVKTYSSLEEVANDFDTTSAAYKAAQAFLRPSTSLAVFKIAFRDTGTEAAETPAEAISAIQAEDNDWYFLTAESHDNTDVLAYANAVESLEKLYVTSSAEDTALTDYTEGSSTDTLAGLKEGNFDRSHGFFHHEADTAFPECTLVAYNAVYPAGSVSWTNLQLPLSASQDPSSGVPLSTAQKGYLLDRNASFTERLGANTIINRGGKVASGEWMDNIRGRDSLESDINTALQILLASQQGGKLPYNQQGIGMIESAVDNVLFRYSQNPRNFINQNYRLTFPSINDVPTADREARVYQSGSFKAELQGAINSTVITGSLAVQL